MSETPLPGIFTRFFLAWAAYFRTLFDARFAAGVMRLRQGEPALAGAAASEAPAKSSEASSKPSEASSKPSEVSSKPSEASRKDTAAEKKKDGGAVCGIVQQRCFSSVLHVQPLAL